MPFLLLLTLSLVCLQRDWPEPPPTLKAARSSLLTWGGALVLLGLTRGATLVLGRQAADARRRSRAARWFGRLRRYGLFVHLAWLLAALYALGWGWTVKALLTVGGAPLPGVELVI